jgi:hypothetical protein
VASAAVAFPAPARREAALEGISQLGRPPTKFCRHELQFNAHEVGYRSPMNSGGNIDAARRCARGSGSQLSPRG